MQVTKQDARLAVLAKVPLRRDTVQIGAYLALKGLDSGCFRH